jgi:hypothetical protein
MMLFMSMARKSVQMSMMLMLDARSQIDSFINCNISLRNSKRECKEMTHRSLKSLRMLRDGTKSTCMSPISAKPKSRRLRGL